MPEPACAYCRRHPAEEEWRPFCSERCKLADLGHWLTGLYNVAGESPPGGDPDGPPDDDL
ncbi:MAG: DNA gyrase inhibitor YacG [Vicinamibacterales bacterium]